MNLLSRVFVTLSLATARSAANDMDHLNIGLEAGDDEVLALVNKGVTSAEQIDGGRKAVNFGQRDCVRGLARYRAMAFSRSSSSSQDRRQISRRAARCFSALTTSPVNR